MEVSRWGIDNVGEILTYERGSCPPLSTMSGRDVNITPATKELNFRHSGEYPDTLKGTRGYRRRYLHLRKQHPLRRLYAPGLLHAGAGLSRA